MEIQLHLINGMAVGVEYVPPGALEDETEKCIVVDLIIVRLMFFWI